MCHVCLCCVSSVFRVFKSVMYSHGGTTSGMGYWAGAALALAATFYFHFFVFVGDGGYLGICVLLSCTAIVLYSVIQYSLV